MTFEHIIKDIDSLPPLSNAAHIVQTLYAGGLENLNITRLVKVIESDAMLSANILRMINSPYYGVINKISSISQAVSLFGSSRIYMLVIQYAVNEKVKADPSIYGFSNSQFNELCHLQSALAYQWYSKVNLDDAKFLSPLALIMESGKLILANEVIKSDYCGEFRKGFNECANIQEYEKDIIGTTSYFLTAMLFEHWNLEPKYVEILKALDSDEEPPKFEKEIEVIRTAINVKEILTDSSIDRASKLVRNMGLNARHFRDVALRLKESYLS